MTKFSFATDYNTRFELDIYKTSSKKKIDFIEDFVFLLNKSNKKLEIQKIIDLKTENLEEAGFYDYQYYGCGFFSNNDNIIDGKSGKDSGVTPFYYINFYLKNNLPKEVHYY